MQPNRAHTLRNRLLLVGALLALAAYALMLPCPLFDTPYSTVLYARDGELLGAQVARDGQWRFPPGHALPDKYARAVVEYEDRRFYRHAGVSLPAIVRAARQTEAASRKQEELREQQLRVELRTAYLRHCEARRRVAALELSVKQAAENFRIVRNRYFAQLAILTDLLDANAVRLDAELQLTTARANVVYTYYQLQRACGGL